MKHPIALIPLLAAVLIPISSLPAATVTSTADSGAGSLRSAILAASPGETISLSVTGAITLTTGELLIDKDLTIIGPGAANLTIQRSAANGVPNFRIFNISSVGIASISGLTVMNGRADTGGGINNSGKLTLIGVNFFSNSATISGGAINNFVTLIASNCVAQSNGVFAAAGVEALGGAIYNDGTMTGYSIDISNNSATGGAAAGGLGGGIYNNGTLALTNSTVNRNSATGGANGDGGGIFSADNIILNTSTVDSNVAASDTGNSAGAAAGGGIATSFGSVTIDRSTVSRNVAIGGASGLVQGGGIANSLDSTLHVDNSTISGNSARLALPGSGVIQGGGLYNEGAASTPPITHTTITANNPGGIFNVANAFLEIGNSIISGNPGLDLLTFNAADVESDGFNLFGSASNSFSLGPGDRINVPIADVRIGPLQNNGGPTFTHALLCGSPAINAGDNTAAPPTDQRGFPRIVGGVIDIGSFEYDNSPPTVACLTPATACTSSNASPVVISVTITDADGGPFTVVWTVDGTPVFTNQLPAMTPPASIDLEFTALLPLGAHTVGATVTDASGCSASCTANVQVSSRGNLYPIALSQKSLQGLAVGDVIPDIYNGVQPGNFGWLTWAGSPSEPTLVRSLTPPGNSRTYINPMLPRDHVVSIGDWVQGKPGISNSEQVRQALDTLEQIDITVPVWDRAAGRGNRSLYHVVAFAQVRILNYHLPKENRITAQFLGLVTCN